MNAYRFFPGPWPLPRTKEDALLVKRAVHLTILLALWFSLALSLVDHHAVERDPMHRHIVLGGTPEEVARVLIHHRHAYEEPHEHPWDKQPRPEPREEQFSPAAPHEPSVIAVQRLDGAGGLILDVFGKAFLPSDWLMLALLPPLLWQWRLVPAVLILRGIVLPVPKPPPRRFSSPVDFE